MAYRPSLKDLDEDLGYRPSLTDLQEDESPALNLMNKIKMENKPNESAQKLGEFSNPIDAPGFENLNKKEQLQRLSMSQFDPANQTPTGGFVPPGTFEQPHARVQAELMSNMLLPEMRMGHPLLNMLGRIGTGTALSSGQEAINPENKNNLLENPSMEKAKNLVGKNALLNAGLEVIPGAASLAREGADVFNPLRFTGKKLQDIRNEYKLAKKEQKQAYKPVTEKYGNSLLTVEPRSYLNFDKKDVGYFTRNVKKEYNNFLNEPTFDNLHKFQSQLGKDWAKIANEPTKINTAQALMGARESTKDKLRNFLRQDPEMLAQYEKGSDITHKRVSPFEATPTLRKIARGRITDMSPKQLASSIKKGTEKELGKEKVAVPSAHPLSETLHKLKNRLNLAKTTKQLIPWVVRKALPNVGNVIQNPALEGAIETINPFYRAATRAAGQRYINSQGSE